MNIPIRTSGAAVAALSLLGASLTLDCMVVAPVAAQELPGPATGTQNLIPEIARWLGSWESQQDTTPDGRVFRFHYDAEWANLAQTVVSISIRQAFNDGELLPLWTGTKAFDPIRGVTVSQQISPTGIMGQGTYASGPNGSLILESTGFGPGGALPPIRDLFEPVEGERAFRTTTSFYRGGEWQVGPVDLWRPRSLRAATAPPNRATAEMSRLVGAWSVTPVGRSEPAGRLDVTWSENEHTLRKRMSTLNGAGAGVNAEGVIGLDPASGTLKGIDFQSMIWPEDRLVHVMFESEYIVSDGAILRLYTVTYPTGEPLMPLAERGGTQREFRETYTFKSDDFILWTTEILIDGEWQPFGGAGSGSELRRLRS